ncbi:MAG: alpha-mannosidase [Acidobacteriia bacterium]|nr:alpha-mannosidase [Terriglobia bacterium]
MRSFDKKGSWGIARQFALVLAVFSAGIVPLRSQDAGQPMKPVLYLIATAHLDSQWNWTVQDTIRQFVPDTFFTNFKYFEQYPHYAFTFEGPIHYMWFKEYYPEQWPTVQKYVADGRWRLAGSWLNAADVNVPSPESLMRQALYGQRFFRQEFNRTSRDVFLPDCFGFGFALPSIAAHSGLTAFSTQKLTWGSVLPAIPFPIGRWKGVDGSTVVAALKPGDYVTRIQSDISVDPKWSNDLTTIGNGLQVGFRYFGTGDIGGAPSASSLELLEKAIANPEGKVAIRNTAPDQLSRDLTATQTAALPEYEGELLLKTHGVGCYTSQAAMKRFNRMNELLADSAERAAVAAEWLAGIPYPGERLRSAWYRVLWHQFHDDLTGTSIPQAYLFSWNDELSAANQFAGVLTSSTNAVAGLLDTQVMGIPLVVYNPVAAARRDPVEATVQFRSAAPGAIRLIDRAAGRDVPVQVLDRQGNQAHILFLADMPSVGYKVFEARAAEATQAAGPQLSVTPASLENARYAVKIDANGDLASIFDKDAGRELLSAPARLEMRDDPSPDKPAWRILYETIATPPREYPTAPAVRVVERGPVRVSLEITRKAAGSTFVQRVMLTDGGDRVDIENLIDWKSPNTLLKASFPFAASNPRATYDLGLGTIERGNNTADRYEVPAQKWADLTDAGGAFGAAVLNDSKYGWDKPADNVLRLTLLHTPLPKAYPYQGSNDLGRHRFIYAIAGHRGDWRAGRVPARAAALNQPLVAFQTTPHTGLAGAGFSMLAFDDMSGQVAVAALKKAEDEDEIVVRVQEQYGRPARTRIRLPGQITAAREINAAEEPVGDFPASGNALEVELKPYQPRTFALLLKRTLTASPARATAPLSLPFNLDGVSSDANRADGNFDGKKHTLAAELLPQELQLDGIPFRLGSSAQGAQNVVVPKGQRITLPPAVYDRLYILAAAVGGNVAASIGIGRQGGAIGKLAINVSDWEGAIGQWDSRLIDERMLRDAYIPALDIKRQTWTPEAIRTGMLVPWDPQTFAVSGIDQIRPGFVKRDEIAWLSTHRHAADGNQTYIMSYLFAYEIDLPAGTREIQLPSDDRLRILAMTAAREPHHVRPAVPLYAPELPEPPRALR